MPGEGPLRLFVAVYPPAEVAERLVRHAASLDLPPCRPVRAEQCHLTLQFIGDAPRSRLGEIVESVERSAAGLAPFTLRPLRLISLPQRGAARLIAAVTDAPPALLELQRRLAHRLARSPRARSEEKFLPHLTLCRLDGPRQIEPLAMPLESEAFHVDRVLLMESRLFRSGAEHSEVAAARLAGPA